jgi:serine O-acetyltransferase
MSSYHHDLAKRLHGHQRHLGLTDARDSSLPDRAGAQRICDLLLDVLFPGFFCQEIVSQELFTAYREVRLARLEQALVEQLARALRFQARSQSGDESAVDRTAREAARETLGELTQVSGLVATDVEAAFANDPAATEHETIVLSYPCIEALTVQRFAHRLYRRGLPLIPRMLTEWAHGRTGIDIHPGAAIDESFFIDHGTGVVIGETSRIGKHCVLYHGVTLGAWNPTAKDASGTMQRGQGNKRHPDLEDHVTVYSGATILGGTTRVGHHSVIGGNVWLTDSVEPNSVVMLEAPKLSIRTRKKRNDG